MVRKHLSRLHYKLKGLLAKRSGLQLKEGLPAKKTNHRAMPNQPNGPPKHHPSQSIQSGKEKTLLDVYSEIPHKKSDFHSYKNIGIGKRISKKLEKKGLPPLPVLILVLVVILVALLPMISAAIFITEPREVDIFVAIQTLDGNVLKNATIFLASAEDFKVKFSSQTAPDGTAEFNRLPVNEKYVIYAEKNGNRINVDEREFKVPYRAGRPEIVIVKKAVN
jgi:hypothetical protein